MAKLPYLRNLFSNSADRTINEISAIMDKFLAQGSAVQIDDLITRLSAKVAVGSRSRKMYLVGHQDASLMFEDLLNLVDPENKFAVKFNTAIYKEHSIFPLNTEREEQTYCKYILITF